jgi:gamma-glutamyl:cysteine ligase YbdK (ATP-grasp superfamily)
MGQKIAKSEFEANDYLNFNNKLQKNIRGLELLLKRKAFGEGPMTIGAELELTIVDHYGKVLCLNKELLQTLNDPCMQPELNKFNIEYNLPHVDFKNNAFSRLEDSIKKQLKILQDISASYHAKMIAIGILPTLGIQDIGPSCMTDLPRYHSLNDGIRQIKGEPFKINIFGKELLQIEREDLTLEGANTSFQIHLRVSPKEYVDTYNAVQLATPLALALGANSPFLLGHRLWDETRVVLFKQSVDTRKNKYKNSRMKVPARVNFGTGWVRKSALELFEESVALYKPLIPIIDEEDPLLCLQSGAIPKLKELRLHQSSIWQWNRAIYDHQESGHLRIEMRALPSGPSSMDMIANMVFLIGTTLYLRDKIDKILPSFPFEFAEDNFYRAAKFGINADLLWPTGKPEFPKEQNVTDIVKKLIPKISDCLIKYGLAEKDILYYLSIISDRVDTKVNGAIWQSQIFDKLKNEMHQEEALKSMVSRYLAEQANNKPISEWSLSV